MRYHFQRASKQTTEPADPQCDIQDVLAASRNPPFVHLLEPLAPAVWQAIQTDLNWNNAAGHHRLWEGLATP
jgi:hypothetical protein